MVGVFVPGPFIREGAEVAPCAEGWVEVDEVDAFAGDMVAEDGQVVAEVEGEHGGAAGVYRMTANRWARRCMVSAERVAFGCVL